ncbi:hypothetical protein O0L34_g3431 [Tuta absoluta]|nr:hypothetical protein O0L34_g3431 [Tuta absoluta]
MTGFLIKVFNYRYISRKDLKGFDSYKYSAIDTSPLSQYVMHPTWNAIVKIIPNFIAPNLLTFSGFLCMLSCVALLSYFDYDMTASGKPAGYLGEGAPMPDWVLTACGVLVFLAYNLDGIDGKQARKIGVSGPLGELFDHGLDSYIVFLIPFCLFSVFGRDQVYSLPVIRGLFIVISVTQNFYVSHVEKYNTGTLYLPWGYDISMWIVSMIFILAGWFGLGVYKFYIWGDVTFVQVFEVVIHATGLLTTLPVAVYNVYLTKKNKGEKNNSFVESIWPVLSMLIMTTLITSWAANSPNNILEYDPRAFLLLYGTLFSHISSRLIVCEMSGARCDTVCWLNWPLLTGVLISLFVPLLEHAVLYSLLLLSIGAHVHYGVCVVRQICDYFKIKCFVVPKSKRK